MSAIATVPSLREVLTAGLLDAISYRRDTGHQAGCEDGRPCLDHLMDSEAAAYYRTALELVEATSDNGEMLALMRANGGQDHEH